MGIQSARPGMAVLLVPAVLVLAGCGGAGSSADGGRSETSAQKREASEDAQPETTPSTVAEQSPAPDPEAAHDAVWKACARGGTARPARPSAIRQAAKVWGRENTGGEMPVVPSPVEVVYVECGKHASWMWLPMRLPDMVAAVGTIVTRQGSGPWSIDGRDVCAMPRKMVIEHQLLRRQGSGSIRCPGWSLTSPPA